MSLRACEFAMKPSSERVSGMGASKLSFAVDGVLDLTPGVDMAVTAVSSLARLSGSDQTGNAPLTIPKGFEWPWKRGEPGVKPAGDPSE